MNQNFILYVDNKTNTDIPFEEIMFLIAIKANQVRACGEEIFIIQVMLHEAMMRQSETCRAIVKLQAFNGEFSGYSYGNRWESAVTNGFESIIQRLRCRVDLPHHQNTN